MPRKNTVTAGTNITRAEYAFLRDVLAADAGGVAQYLRRLIQQDAERRGFNWPGETTERGKYPRRGGDDA